MHNINIGISILKRAKLNKLRAVSKFRDNSHENSDQMDKSLQGWLGIAVHDQKFQNNNIIYNSHSEKMYVLF